MKTGKLIFVALIGVSAFLYGLVLASNLGELSREQTYWNEEIPLIRREVDRMSGVIFKSAYDLKTDQSSDVVVIITVVGKGDLHLYKPKLSSFTGGGPIALREIGDCKFNRVVLVGDENNVPGLHFRSVQELVNSFEDVRLRLHRLNICTNAKKLN
jgi:hypothetical protein